MGLESLENGVREYIESIYGAREYIWGQRVSMGLESIYGAKENITLEYLFTSSGWIYGFCFTKVGPCVTFASLETNTIII